MEERGEERGRGRGGDLAHDRGEERAQGGAAAPPSDGARALAREVLERCDALARCSDEPGRLTRTFLSPAMRDAIDLVAGWMRDAGLEPRLDPAGNLIGERAGADPAAGALWLGSHLDTVVDAGRFDGALGVLAGVAVAGALRGERTAHGLAVAAFSEEEGVRFGTPYLGSRALAGTFDPALLELRDARGASARDALEGFGLDPDAIPGAALDPARVLGFLEPHIEQGPALEAAGAPLAAVAAIAGQTRRRLAFEGRAGHAGTTPMGARRDALPAAAAFALEVEARGRRGGAGLVATVGRLDLFPNAPNVVPGRAVLSLDVRSPDDAERAAAVADLRAAAARLAAERGLGLRDDALLDARAVPLHGGWTARLAAACGGRTLVSGAGHDAAVVAARVPSAMLFVRSPGGLSHHPDEAVLEPDVAALLDALLAAARDPLDARPGAGGGRP